VSGTLAGIRILEIGHMLAGPGETTRYRPPPLLGEHDAVLRKVTL
jgi:hypothetical protein